eukprot:scaffold18.g1903.t1
MRGQAGGPNGGPDAWEEQQRGQEPQRSHMAAPSAAGAVPAPRAAEAACASAAPEAPKAAFHKREDGLNVAYVRRGAAAPAEAGGRAGASKAASKAAVNTGWGNNFVRIDLKKGRGSTKFGPRHGGKRRKRGGGSRWQAPRMRQVGDGADYMEGWKDSGRRCFKCGGTGHFARECTAEQQAQADMHALAGSESEEEEEGGQGRGTPPPPRHAAGSAGAGAPATAGGAAAGAAEGAEESGPAVDVAEQFAEAAAEPSEGALTRVLQQLFGFPAFRGLQLATIQRVLAGESVLSIMPTGMGKSLCYQLPAALLPGLTVVVSPLIALMHNQAASVPAALPAAVLWSGQGRAEAARVLGDVAAGRLKLLFVSPERLANPLLLDALRSRMPLPLLVVDEAHCVAEWGHSFRPAYFRLGAALAGAVRASRVLALTATATRATVTGVCGLLRIPPASVLRDSVVRANLRLHVVRRSGGGASRATWDYIVALLKGGALAGVRSAIVYCAFKEDANQLARLLGARGVAAAAYHAGRDHRERAAVEADFAAGRVRVVVATVAFGMGVHLARVGAVLHATMPRSLEEYVQQASAGVGRAGRDGAEASCYAFLDDADFARLRSLAFSAAVDLAAVRGFLGAVFAPALAVAGGGAPAGAKARGRKRAGAGAGRAGARKRKAAALAVESDGEGGGSGGGGSAQQAPPGSQQAAAAAAQETVPAMARQQQQLQQQEEEGQSPEQEQGEGPADEPPTRGPGQEATAAAAEPARRCFGVLPSAKLSTELDLKEEAMETILSYLQADTAGYLRMLPSCSLSVKVSFYAAPPEELQEQYPAVLAACPKPRNGVYSAPAARLAAAAHQPPGLALQALRELAAGSLIGFELPREEGPAYEILRCPGGAESAGGSSGSSGSGASARGGSGSVAAARQGGGEAVLEAALDRLAAELHARMSAVLACQVSRLDTAYRALAAAAAQPAGAGGGGAGSSDGAGNSDDGGGDGVCGGPQEQALRRAIAAYFDSPDATPGAAGPAGGGSGAADGAPPAPACDPLPAPACSAPARLPERAPGDLSCLALDVAGLPLRRADAGLLQTARAVLRLNAEQRGPALSPLAVARILHGLASPAFPADAWAKRVGAFWGSQSAADFGAVLAAAGMALRAAAAARGGAPAGGGA